MNAQIQRVRKIYAAIRLKIALRIFENKIADFNSAAGDLEISLHGGELAWRRILIVPCNQARKIKAGKFYVAGVEFAATFDRTA